MCEIAVGAGQGSRRFARRPSVGELRMAVLTTVAAATVIAIRSSRCPAQTARGLLATLLRRRRRPHLPCARSNRPISAGRRLRRSHPQGSPACAPFAHPRAYRALRPRPLAHYEPDPWRETCDCPFAGRYLGVPGLVSESLFIDFSISEIGIGSVQRLVAFPRRPVRIRAPLTLHPCVHDANARGQCLLRCSATVLRRASRLQPPAPKAAS
jgi:hypothetical protein